MPKFRSDLDVRPQTSVGGTVTIIKDPISGQFFRLQEAERFITAQLDGATSLEAVQSRVQEKFGAAVRAEKLAGFIRTLGENGLLETAADERKQRRKRRSRIGGNLLYLRLRLFDPDRLLNALIQRGRFFFTPGFMLLSASLILAAIAISVLNWSDIVQEASRLYRFSTLPFLIVVVFVVITAHEFAHGLTCKHFGGEVREMGFLLLCLQPAFYCDVSDAWLFREKSKRLWVAVAGPYFELFLWGLATVAWRLTDTETSISHVSLLVMATSGITTLLNLNPLIQLDGYYLLSDYLDIPNLRQRSFRYLGNFLRSLGGLAGRLPEVSPRAKRIYLVYGLAAWVFSVGLLASITVAVGRHFMAQNQPVAFFAFTGLFGFRLRSRFTSLFRRNSDGSESSAQTKRKLRLWRTQTGE